MHGATIAGEEGLVDIELVGFPSQEEADQIGGMVEGCLSAAAAELSLDMSGLAGVTVAHDYDRALALLDRGFASPAVLVPSNNDGVGIAMNVPVIREGMVRSHLVLHAGIGYALLCGEEEKIRVAVYTLAHEAAHVHDQAQREKAIPGIALNQLPLSAEDWYLFGASCACWDEYAACRLSGRIVPSHVVHWETVFCGALGGIRERLRNYYAAYRTHLDRAKAFREIYDQAVNLLKYFSYLDGHLAGAGLVLQDAAPRAHNMIESEPVIGGVLHELQASLTCMWDTRDAWPGINAYDPLKDVVRKALYQSGATITTLSDVLCVRVLPEQWGAA